MISPLQLDRHFFTKVSIEAQPECDPEVAPDVSANVEVARQEENPRKWMVNLSVSLEPQGKQTPGYLGMLEVVGFFTVNDRWPDDKVEALASVNGASVLYGSIREMVSNVTSRGPWPMVTIGTLSFANVLQEEPAAEGGPQSSQKKQVAAKSTK